MPDLEKLIHGIQECNLNGGRIGNCPYKGIIDMLKEQEPKAIEYHDNPFTGLPVAHCPNCERYVQQFYTSVEEETHYCPWCGKEVKWE